jgi:hypothetical protein
MRPVAAAIAALLASAPSAAIAEAPVAAVAYTGPSDGLAAPVRERIGRFARERALGFADLADPTATTSPAPALLAKAIAAYFEFRYAEVVSLLDDAAAAISATGAADLNRRELADVFLFRALARTELGENAEARDDLVRAATVHPGYVLDPARFRPSLIAAFERARGAVGEGPRAEVELGFPPACQIWLDAASSAGAPELIAAPGVHVIRARCPGHRELVAEPTFAAGRQRYRPALEPLPGDRERVLAATAGAALIWVELSRSRPGALTVSLLDRSSREIRRRWTLRLAGADDARRLDPVLASILDRALSPAAPEPRIIVTERPRPWYRREWVWAAIGAAAAGAVILPFALSGSESSGFGVGPVEVP